MQTVYNKEESSKKKKKTPTIKILQKPNGNFTNKTTNHWPCTRSKRKKTKKQKVKSKKKGNNIQKKNQANSKH